MLPAIDRFRLEIIKEHYAQFATHLEAEGNVMDPLDSDIGELTGMIHRPGFEDSVQRRVQRLNAWRNELALLGLLGGSAVRLLAAC